MGLLTIIQQFFQSKSLLPKTMQLPVANQDTQSFHHFRKQRLNAAKIVIALVYGNHSVMVNPGTSAHMALLTKAHLENRVPTRRKVKLENILDN